MPGSHGNSLHDAEHQSQVSSIPVWSPSSPRAAVHLPPPAGHRSYLQSRQSTYPLFWIIGTTVSTRVHRRDRPLRTHIEQGRPLSATVHRIIPFSHMMALRHQLPLAPSCRQREVRYWIFNRCAHPSGVWHTGLLNSSTPDITGRTRMCPLSHLPQSSLMCHTIRRGGGGREPRGYRSWHQLLSLLVRHRIRIGTRRPRQPPQLGSTYDNTLTLVSVRQPSVPLLIIAVAMIQVFFGFHVPAVSRDGLTSACPHPVYGLPGCSTRALPGFPGGKHSHSPCFPALFLFLLLRGFALFPYPDTVL